MNEITNLNQLVSEIKFFENQAVASYWEIGKRLIKAKEQVEHGNWLEWVDKNLGYSERVTQQLIKIGESYSNTNTYSYLTFSKALALTDIEDEEEREDFVKSHNPEDMTVRELKKEIKNYKETIKAKDDELAEKEDINQMLVRSLEKERNRPSEVVEKEVVPDDYDFIKERNEALHQDLARLGEELKEARKSIRSKEEVWKEEYRKNLEKLGDNSEVEEKLKKDIEGFAWSINGFLRSLGGLIYLTEYADQVSPYSKSLFESTIQTLYEWSCQLKHNYEEHNGEIKKK